MSDAYDALVEAMHGKIGNPDRLDAVLSARLQQPCETCGGRGKVWPPLEYYDCLTCHGAGTVLGDLAIVQVLPDDVLREAVARAIERGVLYEAVADDPDDGKRVRFFVMYPGVVEPTP